MERVVGFEPTFPAWKAGTLTSVLYPQSGAEAWCCPTFSGFSDRRNHWTCSLSVGSGTGIRNQKTEVMGLVGHPGLPAISIGVQGIEPCRRRHPLLSRVYKTHPPAWADAEETGAGRGTSNPSSADWQPAARPLCYARVWWRRGKSNPKRRSCKDRALTRSSPPSTATDSTVKDRRHEKGPGW